jgi:hypothetical protein
MHETGPWENKWVALEEGVVESIERFALAGVKGRRNGKGILGQVYRAI